MRRLRTAGAVILGKTNVPELTITPFTESPTWGITRNPWDRQRTPGGSSGGSASAVAAGLCSAALGSDGARLDPDPRGLLRAVRAQAAARAGADRAQAGAVARDDDLGPDHAPRGGQRALLRRDPRRRRAVRRRGGARARPAADRGLAQGADRRGRRAARTPSTSARSRARRTLLRDLGHEVVDRELDWGPNAWPNMVTRYLRGVHDEGAALRAPRAARAPHARLHPARRH